jgi:hypothetical protein
MEGGVMIKGVVIEGGGGRGGDGDRGRGGDEW